MLRACNETGYLEGVTGLDGLYQEGEGVLEDVEWEEEEGEGL